MGPTKTWAMGQELELLATQPKPPQIPWVGVLPYGLVLVFASKMAHFFTLAWHLALQCAHGG